MTTRGGKREGAGRPVLPDKRIQRTVRLSQEEYAAIMQKANAEGLNFSEYVRFTLIKREQQSQSQSQTQK